MNKRATASGGEGKDRPPPTPTGKKVPKKTK